MEYVRNVKEIVITPTLWNLESYGLIRLTEIVFDLVLIKRSEIKVHDKLL